MATTAAIDTTEASRGGDADTDSDVDTERTSAEMTARKAVLPKDLVFQLLSAGRRRKVLEHANEYEGEVTLDDVAERIAAAEQDTSVGQLAGDQRERVSVSLYQCHLPKLDDANVIDFDRTTGTIELRERAEQLFPYLSLDPFEAAQSDSKDEPTELGRLSALTIRLKNRVLT